MKHPQISFTIFVLTVFVILGSLAVSTEQARAGFSPCDIGITKDADPADDTPFDFTAPGSDTENFTLMDPSNDFDNVTIFGEQPVVTVTEIVPPGWVLEDVVCDDPIGVIVGPFQNNGRTFQCTGEFTSVVNCTFINTQSLCKVTVEKTSNPPDDTEFNFTAPGSDNPAFTLSDPSNPMDMFLFDVGTTVTVTEEVPSGWQLDSVFCTEAPGLVITEAENGVNLECEFAAETVCEFTNSIAPRPIPTLSEWGLIAMAGVLGIIGFFALRRRRAVV